MNCHQARRHWELYYDSEGDSELYLQINEHLAACPSCAKWFFQQAQFEDALTATLAASEGTPELWHRIVRKAGVLQPVSPRRWALLAPVMTVVASLLIVVGMWQFPDRNEQPAVHLSALTAALHDQLASRAEQVEFSSESDVEIEQYLKQRVSFPVRCPPRKDAGFVVRGGGLCDIAGDVAAYVVGQVDERDVSIFILPVDRLLQFAHEGHLLSREALHHCREGDYDMVLARVDRNIVVVIGSGTPQQLEQVVRAYGTYHEAHEAPVLDAA